MAEEGSRPKLRGIETTPDIVAASVQGDRAEQQDALMTNQQRVPIKNEVGEVIGYRVGLYVVCDGVGSMKNSRAASRGLVGDIRKNPPLTNEALIDSLVMYHNDLLAENNAWMENGYPDMMGATTVVAAMITEDMHGNRTAHITSLGDSPAYILRNGVLGKVTDPDRVPIYLPKYQRVVPALKFAIGLSTALPKPKEHFEDEQEFEPPLDMKTLLEERTVSIPLQPDDLLLLETDGLEPIPENVQQFILVDPVAPTLRDKREELLVAGLHLMGSYQRDNITFVLMQNTRLQTKRG